MLVACFETATMNIAVSVGDASGLRASFSEPGSRRHAESLIPLLDQLLRDLGHNAQSLTHVAVDVGPGLFTGLRVGVAAAKALSLALAIPLVPFSSLELLAWEAILQNHVANNDAVVAAIDARRGELYAQSFTVRNGELISLSDPFVGPIAHIQALVGADARIVGDPDVLLRGNHLSITRPSADTMAALIAHRGVPSDLPEPDSVDVIYLRDADADLPAPKSARTPPTAPPTAV